MSQLLATGEQSELLIDPRFRGMIRGHTGRKDYEALMAHGDGVVIVPGSEEVSSNGTGPYVKVIPFGQANAKPLRIPKKFVITRAALASRQAAERAAEADIKVATRAPVVASTPE